MVGEVFAQAPIEAPLSIIEAPLSIKKEPPAPPESTLGMAGPQVEGPRGPITQGMSVSEPPSASQKAPIESAVSTAKPQVERSKAPIEENFSINGQQINIMELLTALMKFLPTIPQQEQVHEHTQEHPLAQAQMANASPANIPKRSAYRAEHQHESPKHVNHIAEAAKFNNDKAINAEGLNEYAAHIGGGDSKKGIDTIIEDIAGQDGKLTDAKIEQYLKDSQPTTDLDDRRISRDEQKGMIAARENLKDALRKNASPEIAQMVPHHNSHKAAPDAPKPEMLAEKPKEQAPQEQAPGRANPKDEIAKNPTTPNGPAQAMAGLAGMAGAMTTASPAVAAALSWIATAATEMVQEKSAQPKGFEYAGSDYSNKSAQSIGNAQSNGKDVRGIG